VSDLVTASLFKGAIRVVEPFTEISGACEISVVVTNHSDRVWSSEGTHPINISYHWLDEEWNMVVFNGIRTPLPEGGIEPGESARILAQIVPPPRNGTYKLSLSMVEEGKQWFDKTDQFTSNSTSIFIRNRDGGSDTQRGTDLQRRIDMTVRCRDCDGIPKHRDAGKVMDWEGKRIQVMHEGTKVIAGGYHGAWMEDVISKLRGHHEPQEELAFHHILTRLGEGSLMVEFGSFWAYYTNWFLGVVPHSKAICIEPDENNLSVGRKNLDLNNRKAEFHLGAVGGREIASIPFQRESDQREVHIPCYNWESIDRMSAHSRIDLLHLDAQGAELPFLSSLPELDCSKHLRFIVVSTHHASISGSSTTHRDCLLELIRRGAIILCEHSVDESFSGDGLIVASFWVDDASHSFPQISRNEPEESLFGKDPLPSPVIGKSVLEVCQVVADQVSTEVPILVQTPLGQTWVLASDTAIGASLIEKGCFEESIISEVTEFLVAHHGFIPRQFIDIGANIGTHLLYALRSGLFEKAIGMEADPANFSVLLKNISLNGLEGRARAFHVPVSDRSGAVLIERSPDNLGDHRVKRDCDNSNQERYRESSRQSIALVSDTLDRLNAEFALGVDASSLVWIDTQGHEGHVLSGAMELIKLGSLQYVVIEFWPYGIQRSDGRKRVFEFLSQCREIYDLRSHNWQSSKISLQNLQELYMRLLSEGVDHTDLLCII
jgi:FkbM family methyltransferase